MLTNSIPVTNLNITMGKQNLNRTGKFFYKEKIMLEVTEAATTELINFFKGKEVKSIRIFLNEGG